ncbi:hypothetical protein D046_2777B, partial [Vibrio parahaemolyticus V-223/04]
KTNGLLA